MRKIQVSLRLPEYFVKNMKQYARQESFNVQKDITYVDLIVRSGEQMFPYIQASGIKG